MTWKELFNTKIADGRTVFEYLFGDGVVEVDESSWTNPSAKTSFRTSIIS